MEENRMYQIYELKEEMEKAIENIKKVLASQAKLKSLVKASPEAGEFEEFLKGLDGSESDYRSQMRSMLERSAKLSLLLSWYEKDPGSKKPVAEVVTLVLEGIGAAASRRPEPEGDAKKDA